MFIPFITDPSHSLDASNTSPADLSLTAERFEVDLLKSARIAFERGGALFSIKGPLVTGTPARLKP